MYCYLRIFFGVENTCAVSISKRSLRVQQRSHELIQISISCAFPLLSAINILLYATETVIPTESPCN